MNQEGISIIIAIIFIVFAIILYILAKILAMMVIINVHISSSDQAPSPPMLYKKNRLDLTNYIRKKTNRKNNRRWGCVLVK